MANTTDVKDPLEEVPFTANFTNCLAKISPTETISSVLSIAVTVVLGVDASPSSILLGSPEISADSKKVSHVITGGLDGVSYKIKTRVQTSSGKKIVIAGIVPVRSK